MVGIALQNAHHGLSTYEVVLLLQTDAQRGLSDHEAERRLQGFGPNLLPEAKRGPGHWFGSPASSTIRSSTSCSAPGW